MNSNVISLKLEDERFPALLKEIANPPKAIYYLGELPANPYIAIVGTRKATNEGKLIAKKIAKDLASKNLVVVSGLALGIDGAAHEGAILGGGKTVAVLAGGLQKIYPREHHRLAQKILQTGGALISEHEESIPYYDGQFLERNRIISGLSRAVVVVEAPARSGSLATARYALEQGREVFVVPGPANHPNYQGSHMLIRNGARLVTRAEDILEDLGIEFIPNQNSNQEPTNQHNIQTNDEIINVLKTGGSLTVDNIAEITKLEPHIVNQRLSYLELEGVIKQEGGKFSLNF
jgi:DNA processing protein